MGKQTVENSLRLDAHFWATDSIRQAAQKLARLLADAWSHLPGGEHLATGEHRERPGLLAMRWTYGDQKTVVGSILWGVIQAEGDQIHRLLLLPSHAFPPNGCHQEVALDWQTTTGTPSRFPVLRCPFCGKRCRYLFAASARRKNGPGVGEFACRICAGLCYAKQLAYRTHSGKSLDAIVDTLANFLPHSRWLTEEAIAEAQVALQSIEEFCHWCLDLSQPSANQQQTASVNSETQEHQGEDLSAPTCLMPPRRRGRPSLKRQRQQERAAAKLLRDLHQQTEPQRPAGRPKTRRVYNADARTQGGCSGRLAPNEGYCVSCHAGRQLVNASPFTASNGRLGIKGQCADCGRGLCRMGGAAASALNGDVAKSEHSDYIGSVGIGSVGGEIQ